MEVKNTWILCRELILLSFWLIHLSSVETVEICRDNNAQAVSVTLELSLSNLTHYEGNCTCRISRINQRGNVTMEADIQIDGCDSLNLEVEKWNYQTSCGEEPGYDHTQFLVTGQFHKIFMNRSLGGSSPTIGGSITFRSLDRDKLALNCEDAIYDIPPSTTTLTTSTTSRLPSILGIVGGVLVGLISLLMAVCLYMRYRRKKQQEAHGTNRQEMVSIQGAMVSGRGDRHYETLDPSESQNPVYDVISSINNQIQDDVIYENGNILQDKM